jgi:hypothetical protein
MTEDRDKRNHETAGQGTSHSTLEDRTTYNPEPADSDPPGSGGGCDDADDLGGDSTTPSDI